MMKISGIVEESIVDGPGIRFTIFFQGCTHNCYKCHNPETHDISKGIEMSVDELINKIKEVPYTDGVTLSGGDPLMQIDECLELCKKLKELDLNIIVYTGYTYEAMLKMNNKKYQELFNYIDYLVDGPFIYSLLDLTLKYRGSSNQRIIDIKETIKNNKIVVADL